jgi:hypothetical protein
MVHDAEMEKNSSASCTLTLVTRLGDLFSSDQVGPRHTRDFSLHSPRYLHIAVPVGWLVLAQH